MKHVLEISDLDIASNPTHKVAHEMVTLIVLLNSISLLAAPKGLSVEEQSNRINKEINEHTIAFLNSLDSKGFAIVKNEIPSVFKG